MSSDLVGKTLGDFEIEAVVGKGSMARVYQACQVSLRRHVALKVLEEGIFTPGDNVKRFLREAEALAQLEHANIVPIYAAGEERPYYFFAMRLIRGGTLLEKMRGGISRAMGLRWSYQICRALAYAHTSGIIHRDLKPTNVLIHDGVALLSDFGLARLRDVSTITHMGYIVGTPLYMAPEQTEGGEVTTATDCFALGVIMYQLTTGHHPFLREEPLGISRAERRARLFRRIQAADCPPPRQHDPKITPEVEALIMKALAKKPEDRHPNGPAMLKALDEAWRRTPEDERIVQYDRSVETQGDEPDPVPENLAREPEPNAADLGSTVEIADENADAGDPNAKHESRESGPSSVAEVQAEIAAASAVPEDKSGYLSLLGRYRVVKEIGHGGQGVVYQAHDPVLDRDVALKVLRKDALSDPQMVELFWNEARVAARLNHPHIITIYDFGIEGGSPFLTMQLIEGASLDHFISKGDPLPLRFALRVLLQAAEAIGFAHQANVIHLDVKPGNILVRQSLLAAKSSLAESRAGIDPSLQYGRPHVLLTDFTMARIKHAAEKQRPIKLDGTLSGTIPYAAPEQLEGKWTNVGPQCDIFSLGVVFYEMLTGKRLFGGDEPLISRELIMSGNKMPRPSEVVATLPQEVDDLCARMLSRDLSARLQSAGDVILLADELLLKLSPHGE